MWLAWRHGACLVPAPRSLVRSGMDLGPWLVSRDITVVSTVPTLAALWPAEALEAVRLLIFGGEACPPELAERLAVEGREVWNTYGPTEATVVACAARLHGSGTGEHRAAAARLGPGGGRQVGRAGVTSARSANSSSAGSGWPAIWIRTRTPRSTRRCPRWVGIARTAAVTWSAWRADGLYFMGRADDQVKVGGRRIELGEVDSALVNLPGVSGGAAAVRRTASGTPLLVGYIASTDPSFDLAAARATLAEALPAALVPRLVLVDGTAHPDLGQGRPRRAAVAAARRTGGRRCARPRWHDGLAGRAVARCARRPDRRVPRPTSSRSAADRCPPRSWSPRCASGIRR